MVRAGEEEKSEVADREKSPGRVSERASGRNTAYFAFYSRVPDSPESGALITVVNCCLGRGASPWQ